MHAQPQLLIGALIDMHLDPLGISPQPAIPLLESDTILITPFTLLAQAEPDQISFLMVQNFDLKLTPIHRLAENRDILHRIHHQENERDCRNRRHHMERSSSPLCPK